MADDLFEQAYEICKAQAQADGAFSEILLRHWFQAAWDLCAQMVGLVYPSQQIREPITLDGCGNFTLSQRPSSSVEIFDGYRLVMVLPQPRDRTLCGPALCCLCHPYARYTVGVDLDACHGFSPTFIQAVARLFTYMVENRGDSELDERILAKSGAMVFLSADLQYVA